MCRVCRIGFSRQQAGEHHGTVAGVEDQLIVLIQDEDVALDNGVAVGHEPGGGVGLQTIIRGDEAGIVEGDGHRHAEERRIELRVFRDKFCQFPSAQKGETILSHGFCTLQQRFVRRGQEALAGENAPSIRYAQGILIQQFHGGIVPHALAETITVFSDSPGSIGHGAVVVFHVGRAVDTNG